MRTQMQLSRLSRPFLTYRDHMRSRGRCRDRDKQKDLNRCGKMASKSTLQTLFVTLFGPIDRQDAHGPSFESAGRQLAADRSGTSTRPWRDIREIRRTKIARPGALRSPGTLDSTVR